MNPSPKVLKAIISLKADQSFKDLVEWIDAEYLNSLKASCYISDEAATRWEQGGARMLQQLLDVIEHAGVRLEAKALDKTKIQFVG